MTRSNKKQTPAVSSIAEPPPVTTTIAATGKRSASSTVKLPWWIEYWQPIVIAVLMALVSAGIMFYAQDYVQKQAKPVLSAPGVLDEVKVLGRLGATPVVELYKPIKVDGVEFRQQRYGTGRIVEPDTPVLLSISSYDGRTGESRQATGQPTLVVGKANEADLGATLSNIVTGTKEGSTFIVGRQLEGGDLEVNVVDVLYTIAHGKVVNQQGPLTVVASDVGLTVKHEPGEAPAQVTTQILIQGDGPQVHEGDQIVAQYLAVNWSTGERVASTWDEGAPKLVAIGDAYPGLREAVVDQRVGSRIAIVVPPDLSTGVDSLCVVVDILGAMPGSRTDSSQSG